jgi:hypothetical protein
VGVRTHRKKTEYEVKWAGYDSSYNEWRPETEMGADDAVKTFLFKEARKEKRKKRQHTTTVIATLTVSTPRDSKKRKSEEKFRQDYYDELVEAAENSSGKKLSHTLSSSLWEQALQLSIKRF